VGKEASCTARFKGQVSKGKALLETDALIFRGDFRLAIPLRSIRSATVAEGVLQVRFPEGIADFELGPQADKWLEKILHPASLLDKLGVKTSALISLVAMNDAGFRQELSTRVPGIDGRTKKNSDLIFFGAEQRADLKRLRTLKSFLKPAGALWVIYPKGQTHIREIDVIAAGKTAGLVDVKVARFSPTHTALKLVIPVSSR
jgi:hypothetical protein